VPHFVAGPIPEHLPMSWCLVAGIARPSAFEADIAARSMQVTQRVVVNDHQPIPESKLQMAAADCDAIITTEKDYYRDQALFARIEKPIFVLPLNAEVPSECLQLISAKSNR
jgi:tetraacyldisaccharide-1-P 4'-kinase